MDISSILYGYSFFVIVDIKETNISPPAPHATSASTAIREVKKKTPDMPKMEESIPVVAHDKYDTIPHIDIYQAQSIPSENEASSKPDEKSDLDLMEVKEEKEEKEHINMELDTPVAEEEPSENQKEDNLEIKEEDKTVPGSNDIGLPETSIDAVPDTSVNESTSMMKPPMQQQQQDKNIEASMIEKINEPGAAVIVEKESSTKSPWQKVTNNDRTYYYNSVTGATQWETPKELIPPLLSKDKGYNDDELTDMTNIQEEHLKTQSQGALNGDLSVPLTYDAVIPQEQQQLKVFVETNSSAAKAKDLIEEEKVVEDALSPPAAVAAIVENEDGIVQNLAESSPVLDDDVKDDQEYVNMDVGEVIPEDAMRGVGDEPKFALPFGEEMIAVEAEDKSATVAKHSTNDGVGGRTVVEIIEDVKEEKDHPMAIELSNVVEDTLVNVEDVVQQDVPTTAVDVGREPVAEVTSTPASSPWQELLDADSGMIYYYNRFTGITQWKKPEELTRSNHEVAPAENDDINDGIDTGAADGLLLQPVEEHINIIQEHKDKNEEEVLEVEDAPVIDDSMNEEMQQVEQDNTKKIVSIKGTTETVDESGTRINSFNLITEQTQRDNPLMERNNSTTTDAAFSVHVLDSPMAVDSSDVAPVAEQPRLDVSSHSAVEINTGLEDTTFVSEFPLVDDVPPPPQQQQVEDQGQGKEMNETIENDEDLMLLSRILSDDDNDERDDPIGNITEQKLLSPSPWQELTDPDSGTTYYFNPETRATQMEKPEEFITSITNSAEVVADEEGIEGTNHIMQQVRFVFMEFWR